MKKILSLKFMNNFKLLSKFKEKTMLLHRVTGERHFVINNRFYAGTLICAVSGYSKWIRLIDMPRLFKVMSENQIERLKKRFEKGNNNENTKNN